MNTNQEKLLKSLHQTLKSLRYLKYPCKMQDRDRIYYSLIPKDDANEGILIEILNSHNNNCPKELRMYREVCKNLISEGYEIKMTYPCYITVRYKFEDL